MSLPLQKFREAVFITLFAHEMGGGSQLIPDMVADELKIAKKHAALALARVHALLAHLPWIDEKIQEKSTEYAFDRIPGAEKNILRLAIFELIFDDAVPHKVAIAESVRLAKKFSTESAAKFVNAIVDAVYSELSAPV